MTPRRTRRPGDYLLALLRVIRHDVYGLLGPWGPAARRATIRPEHDVRVWRTTDDDLRLLAQHVDDARRFIGEQVRRMLCRRCDAELTPRQVADGRTHCTRHRRYESASKLASNIASRPTSGDG